MKKGEETRQKILDEAIVLFAESGYEKASMRELAGRVHIKAPSMYAYFSGKETLFISVSDCRQRSNFKMKGWTFSMHKMKLNVEIPMIRAVNMI